MSGRRKARTFERLAVPALVGLAVAIAACGATSGPGVASIGSSTATTSPESASHVPASVAADYSQALKYSECMRAHGDPDFPDPNGAGLIPFGTMNHNGSSSPSPQDEPGYTSANKVCGHLLPNGGRPTTAQVAYIGSQLLKFSQCMRAHGLTTWPDPTISSRFIGFDVGRSVADSAAFKRAQKSCASFMSSVGP